jgi:hypothetical protein
MGWFLGTVLAVDAAVLAAVVVLVTLGGLSNVAEAIVALMALVVGGLGSALAGLYVADLAVRADG